MKNRILLVLIFFACYALFAETLNLEQARTLALANSRSLAKYNLAIKTSELDDRSRIYSNLPSLSMGASASMTLWSAANAAPVNNPLDTLSSGMNVGVSQRIFEGGKSIIQKAINGLTHESARIDALAEYFNVLDSVDSAYYAVLEAAASLQAEESSLESAAASLAIAEIRHTAGIINPGDYLKAMAEKESRENSRNQARRNLVLASSKLNSLTGLRRTFELEQIDFSSYAVLMERMGTISVEEEDSIYDKFWKLLAAANPSLAKSALAKGRAEKNLSMARTSYSPTLSASFSTGLNYSPNNGLETSSGRVSLSLSIPVDFWVQANNVQKSKLSLESSALDYVSAGIQLETELQSALFNVFANAGSFLSSRRSLEYAEKHFEYMSERYRLSQSSVSEYGDASTLLINSRNSHIKASYGFLQSLSKLRSLSAIDDEERLTELLLR